MLATVLWEYISPVELLTIAASLTATIAVVVDLFLIVSKNIAPWKKTAVLFIVSELAAAVVSCWLGASFVTIVGWCVFALLTAVILFLTIYFSIIKWEIK